MASVLLLLDRLHLVYVGGQTSDVFWRLSSSFVILHGGPVEFRPVRAISCLLFTEVR